MRIKEEQIDQFAGLAADIDAFDVGFVGAVVLTNLVCNRTAMLVTRPGYLPVTFEEDS